MQNPLDAAWAGAAGGLEGAWGDAGAAMAQASPGYVFAERDAEIAAAIAAESGGNAFAAGMAFFEQGQLKQVRTCTGLVLFFLLLLLLTHDDSYSFLLAPLLACCFSNQTKPNQAIAAFEIEVAEHAENAEGWRMLGQSHAEVGRLLVLSRTTSLLT